MYQKLNIYRRRQFSPCWGDFHPALDISHLIYNAQITTATNAVAYFHPAAAFKLVLASGGEGLPAGDGESASDGDTPEGEGLPAGAHTLSAVAEAATLSTSVVALHTVQLVQDT